VEPQPIATQPALADERERARRFALWALVPLFSAGFLSCVPFGVAAHRTGARRYRVAAWVWLALAVLTAVLLAIGGDQAHGALPVLGGLLIFVNTGGGLLHTLAIRNEYARELALDDDPALRAAERSAAQRRRGRELAERDPARALELGVGRPDLAEAFSAGLIDVNHAPAAALEQLPGIDSVRAAQIVELRANGSGFRSAEDLDLVLDLEPGSLPELAARAVFLPRG
jgi:hypothetical protein